MITGWLETLSLLLNENIWFAPLLALLAGVLTSATPCALTSIPLVVGYVGGVQSKNPNQALKLSLVFAAGMAITFTILGALASLFGKLMGMSGTWWYIFLAILMVMMALQLMEVFNFIPSTYLTNKTTRKGYFGAFAAGILGGVFSSPCATPVLVVLLSLVASSGNIAWGILLLLLYSVGHSILVVVAGTSIGFVSKITSDRRYGIYSTFIKYFMGIMVLLIALYLFYLGF